MFKLLSYISTRISEKIISTKPVSGGDISSAYLIESEARKYFLKVNSNLCALEMFHAEQKGLQTIEQTKTIAVPHVHLADTIEGKAFLLMDFIESKRPDMSDYIRFGEVLAELHHCSQKDFGFSTDNFIGSLPQRNNTHAGWAEFYWFERILPQLQSALKAGLIQQNIIPKEKDVIPLFQEIFGDVKPSLLHGDLWGGNYLISTNGVPCLIDPAVYYGHSMVDIAMSGLFGGFGTEFYNAYHEIIPKTENYLQQIDLYQLYYLLVHLNLFGSGYYSSVSSILKKYF
ncbi:MULTISPECIES: fructosamine kinase family protein [unclassified Proteiniphilum]|jgi:fructosamine-3-kinase|uniref:fructosamine kinase family protein n=1 Tax=unclassified Proteiniphilum TaxID=2622718 RepID=UPI00257C3531|nr:MULTISPECIES: fructosamine kinase family protein [unclassified Proteiniphilum]